MTRFGDLMGGNVTPPTPPVPIEPEPDVVEDEGQVDLDSLSKVELEEYGRKDVEITYKLYKASVMF